ncbi:hypothetical protein ACH79_06090 [Bradyrhizobium sp. CCBAU 051011]|nr:hypothetical protein ACH79_06090 [Bradyrhizobium sp. CCBAU 051011]
MALPWTSFKLRNRSLESCATKFSEHEWTAIKPMLPNKPRGVRRVDDRRVLDGIVWVLHSGAPSREPPATYGPRTIC